MRENSQKKVLLSVLGVAILVVAVIGISFAAYGATDETNENTINTGTLMVSYQEDTNEINITDAIPMSDADGINPDNLTEDNESFRFTVSTNASDAIKIPYTVSLTPVNEGQTNPLTDGQVRIYLTKNDVAVDTYPKAVSDCESITSGTRSGSYLLTSATDEFANDNTETISTVYVLKMWVDKSVDISNVSYSYRAKVNVDSAVTPLQ